MDDELVEHMLKDHDKRLAKLEDEQVPRIDQLEEDHAVLSQIVQSHDETWQRDIGDLKQSFRDAEARTPQRIHLFIEVVLAIITVWSLLHK